MMVDVEPITAKVTKNGQISLPAELRHRWGVREVLVVDKGDHAEVRPLPKHPLDGLMGKYAGLGINTDEMRRQAREEEIEIEERKLRRYYGGKVPRP